MNICRFLGPIFQEAGKGKFDCSELDGEGIFRELECENVAVKLDKKFEKNETSDKYPKGCYVYNDGDVYWNKHSVGAAETDSSPICKVGGSNDF